MSSKQVEFQKFFNELDNLVEEVEETSNNVVNQAEQVKKYIDAKAMTYHDLRKMICSLKSSLCVKAKIATVTIEYAQGTPVLIITDDDITSKCFVQVYPLDWQTKDNLEAFLKKEVRHTTIIGNQVYITLNDDAYDVVSGSAQSIFNLLYRITKVNTNSETFVHIPTIFST